MCDLLAPCAPLRVLVQPKQDHNRNLTVLERILREKEDSESRVNAIDARLASSRESGRGVSGNTFAVEADASVDARAGRGGEGGGSSRFFARVSAFRCTAVLHCASVC